MSKTIKTISIVASLFISLVIVGVFLLPKLLNTDAFKQKITQQIEQQTDQKLVIDGDIQLSLFPWLSLKTGAIKLSQPAGITPKGNTNKPLLQVSSAQLGVKLLPLLQNKFELGKIVLKQPTLHFVTAKDGSTSLTGLQKPSDNSSITTSATNTAKNTSATDASSTLGAIAISGVSIINGDVIFEDQSNNTLYQLSQLEIETGNISSKKPTLVRMSGVVIANTNTNKEQSESFSIALESQVSYSDDLSLINLQQLKASIIGDSQSPLADIQKVSTSVAELSFNQQTQTLDIQELNLAIDNGKLSPSLSIPAITSTLNQYKTSTINFRLEERNLELVTRGSIKLQDWNNDLVVKGNIVSESFSPKKLLQFLEIDYTPTDETALQSSKFSTDFTGSAHGLSLRNIDFSVDDSLLIGDVSLMNFEDPHYMFDLDLNEINVDRYTPLDTNTENTNTNTTASASASPNQNNTANTTQNSDTGLAITAPLPLFKKIHANGMFRTSNLQANGAKLSQIVVDVKSKNKEVIIKPKAKLYDGQMNGVITFTDQGDTSTLHIEKTLQGVNFGPLLQDTDITNQIAGKGTAKTDITFIEKNGKQTNNGTIALSVLDGTLKDIDVKQILDEAQDNFDSLRGKAVKKKPAKNPETRFAQMDATLNLNNNVITNNDLNIKAPAFRVAGKGAINLTPKTLDYATSVVVVNTNEGQGGKKRADLRGLSIPVRFYGDLTDPKYKIDFTALLKENSRRQLDRKKEELRQKAAEKLGLSKSDTESSKKDLETELKEKIVEKLFEKLF